MAPTTTVINGQTYYHAPTPKPAVGSTVTNWGMNNHMSGPDGSVWRPMDAPGGGGAVSTLQQRAGGAEFDDSMLDAKLERYLPPAPPPVRRVPRVQPPPRTDFTAHNAAAFARAKDRIGMTGAGAMKSLRSSMGRRGLAGSGIEGAEIGNIVGETRGQLGDVIRDQTITDTARNAALDDRDFAGAIGQRNVDVGFESTARGQDITAANNRASQIPALVSLLRRSRTGSIY